MSFQPRKFDQDSNISVFEKNRDEIGVGRETPAIVDWLKSRKDSPEKSSDFHDAAEEQQAQLSGNRIINPRHYASIFNPSAAGNQTEEEKKKEEAKLNRAVYRSIEMDAFLSNTQSVISNLSDIISTEKTWLNIQENTFVPVSPDQMLYVRNGQPINLRDIPPGEDPRDYLVQTLEEKQQLEDATQTCILLKAEEEVGFVNGQMVDINAYHESLQMRGDIAALEATEEGLESGEISAYDLPPALQERLLERENSGAEPSADITAENPINLLPPRPAIAATAAAP